MTLAHPLPSRQDIRFSPSASPSPTYSPYHSTAYFKPPRSKYTTTLQAQLDPTYANLSSDSYYIDSRQSTPSDQFAYCLPDSQFMQNSSAHYPEVRVQQSTPNNEIPSATPPPLVTDESDFSQRPWNYQDASYLVPNLQQQLNNSSNFRTHKRFSSGSSIGSVGPDSPYSQSSDYPHIVDTDIPPLESFDGSFSAVSQYSKPPITALAQNSEQFLYPTFQDFNISGNNAGSMMAAQTGTRNNMSQPGGGDMSGGQVSSRRSFARGDSSAEIRINTPQLDRTMSDIYQDELFNPALSQAVPSSQPQNVPGSQGNYLSSSRAAFDEILQIASKRHLSASPVLNGSLRRSPFRDTLSYNAAGAHSNPSSPASRLDPGAQMNEQHRLEPDAQAYAQHQQTSRHDFMNPSKTISPKEALLDYQESEEDSKIPLFPDPLKQEVQTQQVPNSYDRRLNRGTTENSNEQSFGSMVTSRREDSSNYSTSPAPHSNFTFMPPATVPPMPQQYPFISQSRRTSSMRSGSDQVPEFPPSFTSMESTKSESGETEHVRIIPERSPPSSQEFIIQRPIDTSAGSGTYTCMGPDCNARFDTAAKLQKHRRENHRTSPSVASTPTTPSSATASSYNQQAAANNVSRNNQPGPHKCEKVNPSTGKPCNTIFSRSYDLTRHEDTIHNNRKQKVRCHLCTEEKTFSRNDALTRHMRVVHPDVDFPGKTRRGRNNDGVDVVRQKIESGRGGR